ncbi:hypothetical protein KM043_003414 [Ampulex compressa]|nr:hypothetical protein KM043_003414 [Ampulex compressa]
MSERERDKEAEGKETKKERHLCLVEPRVAQARLARGVVEGETSKMRGFGAGFEIHHLSPASLFRASSSPTSSSGVARDAEGKKIEKPTNRGPELRRAILAAGNSRHVHRGLSCDSHLMKLGGRIC